MIGVMPMTTLSDSKVAEMFRADRTRIAAALEDLGELVAHQRAEGQGQRRYTLTMPVTLRPGPDYDPYAEAEMVVRGRLPAAVIEASRLWRDEDGTVKIAVTFTPAPSTDQIVEAELARGDQVITLGGLGDLEVYLDSLEPDPAERFWRVTLRFQGIAHPVPPVDLYVRPWQAGPLDIRLMLLGRNIY